MTKSDLIELVTSEAGVTKAVAGKVVDAVFSGITAELKKGGKLTIVGFGTFSVQERSARTGRNPQTGEALEIPAKKSGKFTAGKDLKDL